MYRQSMHVRIRRNDVLTFLFCRNKFPRSVSYCVKNMEYYFANLPNNAVCMEHLKTLNGMLECTAAQTEDNAQLHEYIDKLQIQLAELHNDISRTYFPAV